MLINAPKTIEGWVAYLDHADIPVLRATVTALSKLREDEDNLTGRDIANVVLHDPMMTVRLLRYLQEHRSNKQTEITTIDRAIMMLGTSPFFKRFSDLPLVEDTLKDYPEALYGLMRVISRAYHASLYARDWSTVRYDVDSDEVTVAALLHDMAEILIWCFAPTIGIEIRAMMRADKTLRSQTAQKEIAGFKFIDLQMQIAQTWHLPKILQILMDDTHTTQPRIMNVTLAVSLARHSANSWYDAALPDDYMSIAKLLKLDPFEIKQRINRVTLRAAQDYAWYGVAPTAALIPMLPDS